jgi:hypothetical protein
VLRVLPHNLVVAAEDRAGINRAVRGSYEDQLSWSRTASGLAMKTRGGWLPPLVRRLGSRVLAAYFGWMHTQRSRNVSYTYSPLGCCGHGGLPCA